MLNSTTIFDCSQPQMNEAIEQHLTRPMSSYQIIKTTGYVDARNPGAATAADQQAAAAAAPLKCPRCDSTNTKFCYYNNYSLSQPRHFCKACKRYWTRGGTLRNVPVGGGCRKIKPRVRQPSNKLPSVYRNTNNLDNGLDRRGGSQGQLEGANLGLSGFLYSKNNPNVEMFNGFRASRVTDLDPGCSVNSSSGYSQSHNLGLRFSPMECMRNQSIDSSHLSSYPTLFGSNFSSPSGITSTYSPLMQSVLGSGFEYKKCMNESCSQNKGHMGNFMSVLNLEDMQIEANGGGNGAGIKAEEVGQMKLNQMRSLFSTSIDPSLYNWNINGASNMNNSWSDVSNIGSSVISLL